MPLIKQPENREKQEINVTLSQEVIDTIDRYNEWAGVTSRSSFVEQAAKMVFHKDGEWKKHVKVIEKQTASAGRDAT